MEVPDDLKGTFAEMSPVFKNTHVSRDDIRDHMKTYAEEQGIMNQKGKCMIGRHQTSGLPSLLVRWSPLPSSTAHHKVSACLSQRPSLLSSDVDIRDHMKTYAEEQGIMNQKRKCMIGSIYGEKIMVISPLLK
jgi:hypothetical protein